jgi:hypothetical protein
LESKPTPIFFEREEPSLELKKNQELTNTGPGLILQKYKS